MAKIRADLLARIMEKASLRRAAAYDRIKRKANERYLSNDLAALAVAADLGIPINRYATAEQLGHLRASGQAQKHGPTADAPSVQVSTPPTSSRGNLPRKQISKKPSNSVFVVHGRDSSIRTAMFDFLRAIGLNPIEWTKAIEMTKMGSPHISDILDVAFEKAQAVVVLLTPDDEAQLRPQFHAVHDPDWEKSLRGQARPNVLFEAGLAFGRNERGTVLVEIGDMRPFSDVGGRHTVRLTGSTQSRSQLVSKLRNAGCKPEVSGTDWHTTGNFTLTETVPKKRKKP